MEKKYLKVYFGIIEDCLRGQLKKQLQIEETQILGRIQTDFAELTGKQLLANLQFLADAPDLTQFYKHQFCELIGMCSKFSKQFSKLAE